MLLTNTYQNEAKTRQNQYYCKHCDYLACDKYNFTRHLTTRKHSLLTNTYQNEAKGGLPCYGFICECGKSYKHKQSLYTHKKSCKKILKLDNNNNNNNNNKMNQNQTSNNENINEISNLETEPCTNIILSEQDKIDYKGMFIEMVNQNKELQKMLIKQNEEHNKQIMELVPKLSNINGINVTNNITNIKDNKFYINIFLNEKCKDALSIDQFIDKIEISLSNLLLTKDKGLIEGITNIFIENMNQLSLYERPLHCTDTKRETLYIKQDEWKKDVNNDIVKDAIKQIAIIQAKNINNNWIKAYPDYMSHSKQKDDYIQLVKQTMDDINSNQKKEKIVKKICKGAYIDPLKIDN